MTEDEGRLLEAVNLAHDASTRRANISAEVFKAAAIGSGSYTHALVAAISTIGGLHAPLEQTMQFLSLDNPVAAIDISKIPGWGSSFERGHKDPIWLEVDYILKDRFPQMYDKIDSVTNEFQRLGKNIYPNPSAYTAATCLILGVPEKIATYIFIAARLQGWTKLML